MPTKHGVVPAPTKFCVMNRIFFYSVAEVISFSQMHAFDSRIFHDAAGKESCFSEGNLLFPVALGSCMTVHKHRMQIWKSWNGVGRAVMLHSWVLDVGQKWTCS